MPNYTPLKTLDPTRVKAIITAKWGGTAYKAATIRRVESYSISSHLDSDADPWQLELGNVDHDLNAALARDNEVRVQVWGAGPQGNLPLLSGIMDDANYSENGTLVLTGRDTSSIPVDSDHWPFIYKGMSPTKIIELEAKEIKCATKFQITPIIGGPKRQQTDGSEKYWEFWYRMVRKDGMWIWMLADGTLVISKLKYQDAPIYLFTGQDNEKTGSIPIQNFTWHKTTQGRIGKLGVAWRTQAIATGKKRSISLFEDVNIKDWIRKPQKLIEDKHAISQQSAYKVAVEELFESRVGAIEIVLTVADPGFMIRQNNMAHVDLPMYGIKGDWFVVGSTLRGGPDGFIQDVRLREKKFAISARVPSDPVWTKDPSANDVSGDPTGKAGKALDAAMKGKGEWWECYQAAAQKWAAPYAVDLFMAVMLAITNHETGFFNERSNDMARDPQGGGQTDAPGPQHVEWYDIRDTNPTPSQRDAWNQTFANKGGDGYIPQGYACAVGPMQIFSRSVKEFADKLNGGAINEWFGNRWNPCSSIMAAAWHLRSIAQTTDGSAGDLYSGVCDYAGQDQDSHGMCGYAYEIKNAVENDPGWLQIVDDALNSAADDGGSSDSYVSPFPNITGLIPARTDQGVDYGAPQDTPIAAMGDGKVVAVKRGTSTWPHGHVISYKLTGGANKGAIVFVAEYIKIRADLKEGDTVRAGERIAIFDGNLGFDGGGIETGYAKLSEPTTPCVQYAEEGKSDGQGTSGGRAFARFLRRVGVDTRDDPGEGDWKSKCR